MGRNAKNQSIRLRTTATDKAKALDEYDTMRAAGRVKKAIVIVERPDSELEVLGQMLKPFEILQLLYPVVQAMGELQARQNVTRREARREVHEQTVSYGQITGPAIKTQAITEDATGILQPPTGEHFISCGECLHPRFYVLNHVADETPARFSCAHCGNEVVVRKIYHPEGTA